MNANLQLKEKVSRAFQIANAHLKEIDATGKLAQDKDVLCSNLDKDVFLKVPFIGDFNAGKSSLINALMNKPEFLPTAITPETAVAYELYYSIAEKLEIYRNGTFVEQKQLSEIGKFPVSVGDVVRVYVNNEFIKSTNEAGIVIVDMPGISSGISQHNSAIMNYIQEGTVFVVCTDVEQGTLAGSTISFLQEIKAYGLKTMIIVTKADMKTAAEGEKVKVVVADGGSRIMGEDIPTILASDRIPEQVNNVNNLLSSIDSESLIHSKYDDAVKAYINEIVSAMVMRINVLSTKDETLEKKLAELNAEKESAITSLRERNENAQSVSGSADDIVQDVKNALMMRSGSIAGMLFNGATADQINTEIISIIRPVLINSFKRELEEYQLEIGDCLRDFSSAMQDIINGDNAFNPEQFIGDLVQQDVVELLIKKGMAVLIAKFAGKKALTTILGIVAKIAAPIASIIIFILPDLLSAIFGKSKNDKIREIKEKVQNTLIVKLTEAIRPQIESLIEETRKEAYLAVEGMINEQVANYDAAILKIKEESDKDEASKASCIEDLQNSIEQLKILI